MVLSQDINGKDELFDLVNASSRSDLVYYISRVA